MYRRIAAACVVVTAFALPAGAEVNLNLSIGIPVLPVGPPPPPPGYGAVYQGPPPGAIPAPPQMVIEAPPRFIFSPGLGFYVSVETPYDMVYIGRHYYLYSAGYWYASPDYWGPWAPVSVYRLPLGLRRFRYEQIIDLREREYRAFSHDREHYRGRWHEPSHERREEWREEREDRRRGGHRGDD